MPLVLSPLGFRAWIAVFLYLAAAGASTLRAHDTFFRVPAYRVDPGEPVEVTVLHGTFEKSVLRLGINQVERLFLASPDGEAEVGTDGWAQESFGTRIWVKWQALRTWVGRIDKRMTSRFQVTPRREGSYMIAMALHPAVAALNAETFNQYLAEQGLQDAPVARHGITDPEAIITERWRKYVKLLLQVGDTLTNNVIQPAGLVVEFVPLSHPVAARPGMALEFQLLWQGSPLPEQPVNVGRQRPPFGAPPPHRTVRSDAEGHISVPIDHSGVWWMSFVHIIPAPPGDDVAWESFWATLTFAIP